MKIKFILDRKGLHKDVIEFSNYTDILKYSPNLISEDVYSTLLALENNKEFVSEVQRLRKKYNIPLEGHKNLDERNQQKDFVKNKDGNYKNIFYDKSKNDCEILASKLNIHEILKRQIWQILVLNTVDLPIQPIVLSKDIFFLKHAKFVAIMIEGDVSENAVKTFVNTRWQDIKKYTERLQKVSFGISERDALIVQLREEEKLSYKEIVEKIPGSQFDASINEDSVKTAYKRAKTKIKSIYSQNDNNNL